MLRSLPLAVFALTIATACAPLRADEHKHGPHKHGGRAHGSHVDFSIRSVADGPWSSPKTWNPKRVPGKGDRVLVSRKTDVTYDVAGKEVLRMVHVVGKLRFARDRDTELNVALLKVQNSDDCSESGFACDFPLVNKVGEPHALPEGDMPLLEIGTPDNPIPAKHTARIRLHYIDGMDKTTAPALACCSARMEIHGVPLSRTWVKLGDDAKSGDATVTLAEDVSGWNAGDEIIVTATTRGKGYGTHRGGKGRKPQTEERRIRKIDGRTVTLDKPLTFDHAGRGKFRGEVANLTRNVVVESADPEGVRGHTVYHRFSKGGISYARFAHLGKEAELGRYAIHFHLVGDTMRGSAVVGVAVTDSHNRWVTIHGTQYLLVRDCVGYQSVGHGYFLEDGTEMYNVLDRNLGVQAYFGKRLRNQALPFDPNDGAAFWWGNGRNTIVRNVAVENDRYGYRYDMQRRSNFDSELILPTPDGKQLTIDVRTIPISRFEQNESHTEGLYSVAVAGTDGAGPDVQHPHRLKGLKLWNTHYALRAQLPTMLVEDVHIHRAAYGIYRPWFKDHVYRNLHIDRTSTEPFNRGLDDRSRQHGKITVDGLTFSNVTRGGRMPLIQISADNLSGDAESHFRNVKVEGRQNNERWPLVNLGGGPRRKPTTARGVPIFVHDYFGKGRHAKVVSTRAKDLLSDGNDYKPHAPLTGDESAAAEVKDVTFPELLKPVDDLPPATAVTAVRRESGKLIVTGFAHDDGEIAEVTVNGRPAKVVSTNAGVVDWTAELNAADVKTISAFSKDRTGNVEALVHKVAVPAGR